MKLEPMISAKNREIKDTVREFLKKNYLFWSETSEIADDQSLVEEGIIDSTGILELAAFLESTFGITIADDEFVPENLDTLEAIGAYIARKRNGST